MRPDDLPIPPPQSPSMEALMKARTALQTAVKEPRPAGWRTAMVRVTGTMAGLFLVIVAVLVAAGASSGSLVMSRWATLSALAMAGVTSTWAALKPQGGRARLISLGLIGLVAVLLVVLRGTGMPSEVPQWVCTATHFTVGLIPAAVVLFALRNMNPSRLRSLVAGFAVGAVGAAVGEIGCSQSAQHVALFHWSAWAAIAVLVAVVSMKLKPHSYAP